MLFSQVYRVEYKLYYSIRKKQSLLKANFVACFARHKIFGQGKGKVAHNVGGLAHIVNKAKNLASTFNGLFFSVG